MKRSLFHPGLQYLDHHFDNTTFGNKLSLTCDEMLNMAIRLPLLQGYVFNQMNFCFCNFIH